MVGKDLTVAIRYTQESDRYEFESHLKQTTCMTSAKLLNLHCETMPILQSWGN